MRTRVRKALGLLACLAALAAAPARADDVQVVSPRADSASVTIYRDLFALVTETRTVDLPAGPVTLVFEDVIDTVIPQSAALLDAGRTVSASAFSEERLTPRNLLEKSIGKTVTLTRTHRRSGRVQQVEATIEAVGSDGVVFRTADGNEALRCSGLPERLTLVDLPGSLQAKPALSVRLAAGEPGRRQVRISYLAYGFGWQADYVADLADSRDRMDLQGWITLHNFSDSGFRNAEVQVIAGRLNLLDEYDDRGTSPIGATQGFSTDEAHDSAREYELEDLLSLRAQDAASYVENFSGCYPQGPPRFPEPVVARALGKMEGVVMIDAQDIGALGDEEIMEVVVTGIRSSLALRERLADYQLYRLPERTDLAARQTKQVAFLHKPEVKVERFYALRLASEEETSLGDFDETPVPATIRVGWLNRESEGLGEPLPGGKVRFFENGARGRVFTGDAKLRDSPVDTPVELATGRAIDVSVTFANAGFEPGFGMMARALLTRRVAVPLVWSIRNAGPEPIVFELRQGPMVELENARVRGANVAPFAKAGDVAWRVTVPANDAALLTYKLSGKIDFDEL